MANNAAFDATANARGYTGNRTGPTINIPPAPEPTPTGQPQAAPRPKRQGNGAIGFIVIAGFVIGMLSACWWGPAAGVWALSGIWNQAQIWTGTDGDSTFDRDAAWAEADAAMQRGELKPIPVIESYVPAHKHTPPAGWKRASCPPGAAVVPTGQGIECR